MPSDTTEAIGIISDTYDLPTVNSTTTICSSYFISIATLFAVILRLITMQELKKI